ncbi:hypothetical protein BGZ65_010176 [Modicella reniformis]|uniref:Uncharacterized protein n=1 Tax=Modicella reniformis TaxID=1440133 RepID=A0A9P6LV74_9FUNG|nr:hypothetical protein BGZ65_010176 [Modicella reniformis]
MNGQDLVLFLTDDDLEDLIPLRIAHHPDEVLDVVPNVFIAENGLGDFDVMGNHSSALVAGTRLMHSIPDETFFDNDGNMGGKQPSVASSSSETRSSERDTPTLKITEIEENMALVVHSQGSFSETPARGISERSDQLRLEMDSITAIQEQLRQMKQQLQQVDEILQQTEHSHQQLKQRVEEAFQKTQQMDKQKDMIDGILQKMEQEDQQAKQSQQQTQLHIEEILQKTQRIDQQHFNQQLQQLPENTLRSRSWLVTCWWFLFVLSLYCLVLSLAGFQRTRQMDQHQQQINMILQQMDQQTQHSQQQIDDILQKMQKTDQQTLDYQQQMQLRIEETLQMIHQADQHQHQQQQEQHRLHCNTMMRFCNRLTMFYSINNDNNSIDCKRLLKFCNS